MPEKIEIPAEIIAALTAGEMTYRAASQLTGVALGTLHNRVHKITADGEADGVQRALDRLGIQKGQATGGWIKDRGASVRFRIPQVEQQDTLDQIVTRLSDIRPVKPSRAPKSTVTDLLATYTLFDMHFGLRAHGAETGGQDYDIRLARQDLEDAFTAVADLTPAAEEALLILGGDNLHADNEDAETPKSKHRLDVDGRHGKVAAEAVDACAWVADFLLTKHQRVTIEVMRGNHDPNAHLIIIHALAQRYRNSPRVTVRTDLSDVFMHRWGRCSIFAHHGDKRKPQELAMLMSEMCPWWSETRHRHLLTGHTHHDASKDFPGIKWESLRAFCPPDAYGAMFGPRRALQSMTFHRDRGLIQRAYDYIERRNAA